MSSRLPSDTELDEWITRAKPPLYRPHGQNRGWLQRPLAVAAAVLLIAAGVGIAAWGLRDDDEPTLAVGPDPAPCTSPTVVGVVNEGAPQGSGVGLAGALNGREGVSAVVGDPGGNPIRTETTVVLYEGDLDCVSAGLDLPSLQSVSFEKVGDLEAKLGTYLFDSSAVPRVLVRLGVDWPGPTVEPGFVLVPKVAGLTLDEATLRILEAGLAVVPSDGADPEAVVLRTRPDAGTPVEQGGVAELVLDQ